MPVAGPFCFKNTTKKRVNDLHVIFTGTGGLLKGAKITKGPSGIIKAHGNQVDIFWKKPIAPGTVVCFTVITRFPIKVYRAIWTLNFNPVGFGPQMKQQKFG